MTMTVQQKKIEPAQDAFRELRGPLTEDKAIVAASRCLECGREGNPAPCTVACPTHIDIPRFIRQIYRGEPLASADTIFTANVLGGSCARVCPVEELCEGSCVLVQEGRRAVEIGRLQRYATDAAFALEHQSLSDRPAKRSRGHIGIIGAGPAGLACAAELLRVGHQVTIYEARSQIGGLIPTAIAPYKQWTEPLPQEVAALRRLGVQFKLGQAVGEGGLSWQQLEARHEAIFLGVGLGADVLVSLPGADLKGIWPSLEFIEQLKSGNPPELAGRWVAVIGGGNTAIDVAREALRLQASQVTVLYRRDEAAMPAYAHEVREAKEEGVRFQWQTMPLRFLGAGQVSGIECRCTRLVPVPGDRPRPEPVEGSEFTARADVVILAIGQRKRTELLEQLPDLHLKRGLLQTDERGYASGKYYAGGDCLTGGATVVEAVAQGKRAAQAIHQDIERGLLS